MADPARRRATYEDILSAPDDQLAQIVDGDLHLLPRPAKAHAIAHSALAEELGPPFKRGRGGPGGWMILYEPEIHFGADVLVPDLAGWRRDRVPSFPADPPYFTERPDWVCEVLSPSTQKLDRAKKLPLYARERVDHAWLVDPAMRTLEVFELQGESWLLLGIHRDEEKVPARPFDAIELELAVLWAGLEPGA